MDYLYIEADEDHVSLQFREKKGDLRETENHQKNNCLITKLVYVHEGIEGAVTSSYVTKYVLDLDIVPVIREIRIYADTYGKIHIPQKYKSGVTYGSAIKAIAVDLYSEGVMSNERICSFLNNVSGNTLCLSTGSVYGFIKSFSEKAVSSLAQIEEELLNEKTVCTDSTNVTVNGKPAYIRNISSEKSVMYYALASKSIKELNGIEFLTKYAGNLEHDHETALYHFGTGHGDTEEALNHWSVFLTEHLCEMNEERKNRIRSGRSFTASEITAYEKRYDEILEQGRSQNKKTKGTLAKNEEKTLLNRL